MLNRILFCAGLAIAIASPAAAATYKASILNGSSGIGSCGEYGVTSAQAEKAQTVILNDGGLNCTVSASAYAGPGGVGYRATSTYNGNIGPVRVVPVEGFATATMTDIYLTPLFNPTDPVALAKYGFQSTVTVNAAVEGVASADASGNASGSSSISAQVRISGFYDYGSSTMDSVSASASAGVLGYSGGIPFENIGTSMTPSILQHMDIPFQVFFYLGGSTTTGGNGAGGIASSTVDAYNSLSFSKTGPAFILSDGFTVNAPELNIFNNQWIDPRETTPPSPVPLPAGGLLLLSGLAGVGGLKRRKKRSR